MTSCPRRRPGRLRPGDAVVPILIDVPVVDVQGELTLMAAPQPRSGVGRARTRPPDRPTDGSTPERSDQNIPPDKLRGDIVDHGGHLRDGYGLTPGDWVLVRPDGYIGAIVSSNHTPALATYLDSVGLGEGGQ